MRRFRCLLALAFVCCGIASAHATNVVVPSTDSPSLPQSEAERKARIQLQIRSTGECGDPVALIASVDPPRRKGDVEFFDGVRSLGKASIVDGTARLRVTDLHAGAHTLTAVLVRNHAGPKDVSNAVTLRIAGIETSVQAQAAPNPANADEAVTLTATVTPARGGGSIEFFEGSRSLGVARLHDGTGSIVARLAPGSHEIHAVFSGDLCRMPSTSPVFVVVVRSPQPSIITADAHVREGDSGMTLLRLFVRLSHVVEFPVSVGYRTTDGQMTAIANDYVPVSGTLSFAPGDSVKEVSVQVVGDRAHELLGWFWLELSNPVNARIENTTARGWIDDDDPVPGFMIGSASVREGNEGNTDLVFPVTLTNPTRAGVASVSYVTQMISATPYADYETRRGSISIPRDSVNGTIVVPIIGDRECEQPDETFRLRLEYPSFASILAGMATGTIEDDDCLGPPSATVVVPDHFRSIQEALDAAPETVLVRSGNYPERPTIRRDIVLRGHPRNETPPAIEALAVYLEEAQEAIVVEGFAIHGAVKINTLDEVTELLAFRRCRIDGGITHDASDVQDLGHVEIRNCVIRGGVGVGGYSLDMRDNQIEGSVGSGSSSEGPATVHNNTFEAGPEGAYGVVLGDFGFLEFSNNVVRGYQVGAHLRRGDVRAVNNFFENCSAGLAISADHALVQNNRAQGCGIGISLDLSDGDVVGNRVLGSRYDGMFVMSNGWVVVRGNVVGRSGGAGIHAFANWGGVTLRNNTSYLNGGSGILLGGDYYTGPTDSVVVRNVAYKNGRYGIERVLDGYGALECNDWFGNTLGAAHGSTAGSSDLDVDPLFCDVEADQVGLTAGSPLAGRGACGLIGALPVACESVVREVIVSLESPARVERFGIESIAPNPSRGLSRIGFAMPRTGRAEITILDLQGREIARLADREFSPGRHEVSWDGRRNGGAVPAGVYFVRFRHPEGQQVQRLLLAQ